MSEKNVVELDDRRIEAIWWNPAEGSEGYNDGYSTGMPEVTDITVCHVAGEMAHVPWFEVWKGEILIRRVPARAVDEVVYGTPPA